MATRPVTAIERLDVPIDNDLPAIPEDRDVTMSKFLLDGKKLKANLIQAVLDGSIRRTIKGASEVRITLYDPDGDILRSDLIRGKRVFELEKGLAFRLVKLRPTRGRLELVFEDREVSILRERNKPRRAFRDKVTRAQFARMLVREHKVVDFFSPEIYQRQPIAEQQSTSGKNDAKEYGFAADDEITVKNVKADRAQRKNIEAVLDVGVEMNMPRKVLLAAIVTITQESTAKNLTGGHLDSAGLFQQRPSQGWGTYAQVRNVQYASRSFYRHAIDAYRDEPGLAVGALAQTVQRSAHPSAYNRWLEEAKQTLEAYGSDGGSGSVAATRREESRFAFSRGRPGGKRGENTWQAIQRLAEEVNWRCFSVRGKIWFITEEFLFRMKPVRVITPTTDGLEDYDGDFDIGKPVASFNLIMNVKRWEAQPGTVVKLKNFGPLNGKWLITETERGLFSPRMTVTIEKPEPKLPEPASDSTTLDAASTASDAVPAKIQRAYAKAQAIHKKRYPYVWGGGHGSFSGPYDCSGAVSAVLHAAGELSSPLTSGLLERWGAQGEGKYMTVWANDGHTFIVFDLPGKDKEHFGTGDWGKGWRGAGFNPDLHPTDGFHPRHIRGM